MKNQKNAAAFLKFILPMSFAILLMIMTGCSSTVSSLGGGTITLTPGKFDPKNYGYVTIKILPPAAMAAGGAWNVKPGATGWSTNNPFLVPVALNQPFIVTFKPISGWQLPTNQQFYVKPGDHIVTNVNYILTP